MAKHAENFKKYAEFFKFLGVFLGKTRRVFLDGLRNFECYFLMVSFYDTVDGV